jgi:hypothetical protein
MDAGTQEDFMGTAIKEGKGVCLGLGCYWGWVDACPWNWKGGSGNMGGLGKKWLGCLDPRADIRAKDMDGPESEEMGSEKKFKSINEKIMGNLEKYS